MRISRRVSGEFSAGTVTVTISHPDFTAAAMAIDLYWASGSAYSWRVLLALQHKRLPFNSHLLQFSRQEQKSPQMLALNPRGRVPVLKDGDYVVFESLAVLYYLDLKYPEPPIFGRTPEEAAVIMRVIGEFQAYTEEHLMMICRKLFESGRPDAAGDVQATDLHGEQITSAMHVVAREARTIEQRLSRSDWIVGESYSACDMVIFPAIQLLRRALDRPQGRELSSRFLPIESNYPALGRWLARIEALPGYERTYPPHWR
jgi:glutathione S-transferase